MNELTSTFPSIPNSWVLTDLGTIATFSQGIQVPKPNQITASRKGFIRFLRIVDYTKENEDVRFIEFPGDRYCVESNDLVMIRYGSAGKICRGYDGAIANNLFKINLKLDELNKSYFFYFLQSSLATPFLEGRSKATTMAAVNFSVVSKVPIPLPNNKEQEKIVTKLEELFTKLDVSVAELKKAKAQIKRYRQSVLKSAFEGKLTEKWRSERQEVRGETAEELLAKIKNERKKALCNKYKAGTEQSRSELPLVETTNLQPLPEGWVWTCLGDIITVSSGNGLTSSNMKSDGRYAVYGGNGISGYYDKYMFEEQKLIIGRVGAKCGVVHITEPNSWVTDNALIVELNSLDMKFMFYLIHVLNLNQHSVSTAQPVISGAKIYPTINPLPPFNEQLQIVSEIERHFSVADETEKIIDQSLKQAERLRQSILKDAFTGKLVPQDPYDEPAEKLLERIRAEREKTKIVISNKKSLKKGHLNNN